MGAPIYPTALAAPSKVKSGEQECSPYTGGTGGLGEEQLPCLRQERLGWEGQSIKNKGWVARAGAEARFISAA